MKKMTKTIVAISIGLLSIAGFTNTAPGSLKGRVIPAEGGSRVIAISATDTFSATISTGVFVLSSIKAGNYNLLIEAKAPYNNATLSNIAVKDGEVTDVGEIQLVRNN